MKTVLVRDQSSVENSQPPVTPEPKDSTPLVSEDTFTHVHISLHRHTIKKITKVNI